MLVLAAATLALVLVGCGSGSGDDGSSDSGASNGGSGTSSTTSASSGSGGSATSGSGAGGNGTGGGESCAGTCVATPPPTWEGPFEVFASAAAPPACDAGWVDSADLQADLVAPAGTCACDCGQPSGLSCEDTVLHVSTNNNFQCTSSYPVTLTPNVCLSNPPLPVASWFTATGGKAQGGVCNATVTPMLDAPTFATSVRACGLEAPSTTGCDGGSVCAPPRAAGAKLCLAQDGDVECPAGWSDRIVTYTGALDTRTCPDATSCSCTVDASCSGEVVTHHSTDCSGAGHHYNSLSWSICLEVKGVFDGVAPNSIQATATASGTCDSAGDLAPDGTVTPEAPRTFCCQPD